jgi:EpsI family protein
MKRAAVIALIVILAGGAVGNSFRFFSKMPSSGAVFSGVPFAAGEYAGAEHFYDSVSYDVLKADTSTLRYYTDQEGRGYWLFVAYFASQKYGSQIHSPKHCLPGSGWRIESNSPYQLALAGGASREVNRLVIADIASRQLMFYWFETRGGAIRNEFGLKFDLVRNALSLSPTDAAIVRLTVPLEEGDSIDSATQRGLKFLAAFFPDIERALPFGRS